MAAVAGEVRGRGRPRDRARHLAVLDATVELLAEVGYDGLTLADVARRAGVGRPLLYQWWASKGALVAEALFERDDQPPTPDTGSLAGDLAVLITNAVEGFARPEMRHGLQGLIAEINTDAELRQHVHDAVTEPVVRRWNEVVERGFARSEVRSGITGDELFTTVRGAALFHLQAEPDRSPADLATYLTELFLRGIRA